MIDLGQNWFQDEICRGKFLHSETPHNMWIPNMSLLKNRTTRQKTRFQDLGHENWHKSCLNGTKLYCEGIIMISLKVWIPWHVVWIFGDEYSKNIENSISIRYGVLKIWSLHTCCSGRTLGEGRWSFLALLGFLALLFDLESMPLASKGFVVKGPTWETLSSKFSHAVNLREMSVPRVSNP